MLRVNIDTVWYDMPGTEIAALTGLPASVSIASGSLYLILQADDSNGWLVSLPFS